MTKHILWVQKVLDNLQLKSSKMESPLEDLSIRPWRESLPIRTDKADTMDKKAAANVQLHSLS